MRVEGVGLLHVHAHLLHRLIHDLAFGVWGLGDFFDASPPDVFWKHKVLALILNPQNTQKLGLK